MLNQSIDVADMTMGYMTVSEPTLNVVLAGLLVKRQLKALGEAVVHGKKPDVLLSIYGIKIIIEGKYFKQNVKNSLIKQCDERFDLGLCEICVSVIYPDTLLDGILSPTMADIERLLQEVELDYNITWISKNGIKNTGWSTADIDKIANMIRSSYTSVVKEDIVGSAVQSLNDTLDNAISELSLYGINLDELGTRIKAAIGLPEELASKKKNNDDVDE